MLTVLVQEKILGLQVSVNDVSTVAVVDSGQDLLYDIGCILLAKVLLRCNSFEKFTSIAKSDNNQKIDVSGIQVKKGNLGSNLSPSEETVRFREMRNERWERLEE